METDRTVAHLSVRAHVRQCRWLRQTSRAERSRLQAYGLGLLNHGFLEDALPILEALSGMVDDADMEYNLGICLSELGKINESVVPLEKCIALDPQYVSGLVGLGVAYVRLGRLDEADTLLRQALQLEPSMRSRNEISRSF